MDCPFIDIHRHRERETAWGYSYGVHPWWLDEKDYDPEQDLRRLKEMLDQDKLAAIGETGIDSLHEAPLALQAEVFEKHILLSEQYRKPLIIHNVKGNDTVLRLHRTLHPRQAWILHGFNGTAEEAVQLTGKGLYLSVGTALLFKNRKIIQSIKSIPLEYLFFETDTAECGVEAVYDQASSILQIPIGRLKEIIFTNFARLNLDTWKTGKNEPDCSSETRALIDLGRAMS